MIKAEWTKADALDLQTTCNQLATDCINRQAAIDMVEKESQVDGAYGYMDTKSIVDLLNDLPSAQRWIPVSELPEEDTDVLISYRYKEGEGDTSHVYIDITSYGDMYFGGRKVKGAKHWRQPFEYFTSNYEVVAWMPLPDPWKEEEG